MDSAKNQTVAGQIWDNSATNKIVAFWYRKVTNFRKTSIRHGLLKWKPLLESLLAVLIAFMPVIQSWELIIPLMVLLWLGSNRSDCPVAKELFAFWVVLIISAIFSGHFQSGVSNLITWGLWLGIAYLGGKIFSITLIKKFLGIFCFSSLLWNIIGFWQQMNGVPTPTGWLGSEVINWIKVRSYSVFGNPNNFALYLLIILVISSDSIVFFAGCLKIKTGLLGKQDFSGFRSLKSFNEASTHEKRKRILLWLCLFSFILILSCASLALYYTYSRFAWFLGIIFLGLQFWPYFGKKRWFVMVIAFLFLCAVPGLKIRISPLLNLTDSSMWYRIRIWQGVFKAITDHWLWGSGPGSFGMVYPGYRVSNTVSFHAHQLYMQIWLENGILSLMAFLCLFRKLIGGHRQIFRHWTRRILNECPSNSTMLAASSSAIIVIIFLGYGLAESWTQNQLISGYFWLFCGLWIRVRRA